MVTQRSKMPTQEGLKIRLDQAVDKLLESMQMSLRKFAVSGRRQFGRQLTQLSEMAKEEAVLEQRLGEDHAFVVFIRKLIADILINLKEDNFGAVSKDLVKARKLLKKEEYKDLQKHFI